MLLNGAYLRPGSILFIRSDTWISKLIRRFLGGFEYSHVAYYMGIGLILESDWGGVQINPISRYLDNPKFCGEVVNPALEPEQVDKLTKSMLEHLKDEYDYSLLFGNALAKLSLRCNKSWVFHLFDHADGWICSELIAFGLLQLGVRLPAPPREIDPKDLYDLLQKELEYER